MHSLSQIGFDHWTGLVGWIVSVATVLGLALVLRHERRQARSLVERSKELERLSSELLRVNRMKSEFLANVSHELRTPLNAIVGFVDLLREGVYGDLAPRQVKPVERIEASATHLRQILMNLLGNAVKYTNEGGIVIRTRLVDSLPDSGQLGTSQTTTHSERATHPATHWIGIQVIDTGIGIDPADQTRIFEEFEQVDAGPRGNSAQRGTGLGLAISRRLAALIGGMVELESELGKGSTFTLWLPVDPDDLPVTSK